MSLILIKFGQAAGIYSYPRRNQFFLTCNLINNLAQRHDYNNWLIFWDFNILTYDREKIWETLLILISRIKLMTLFRFVNLLI